MNESLQQSFNMEQSDAEPVRSDLSSAVKPAAAEVSALKHSTKHISISSINRNQVCVYVWHIKIFKS